MDNNLAIYDAQKLEVKNLVCLYTIRVGSNIILNLTPHSNSSQVENLQLGSITFVSLPIQMETVEYSSSGALNRPSITIANIEGAFSNVDFGARAVYDFILGSKVTKRTTFEKFINKFNTDFPTGNLEDLENNLPVLRKETFVLDRVSNKNIIGVTFELASPYDLNTVKLPNKVIYSGYCPYIYKGARNYRSNPTSSIGGCNWNNQVNTNLPNSNVVTNVFMNRHDEYIVRFNEANFITPIPISETGDETDVANETIKKGHYYYSENSSFATQIQSTGSLLEDQPVNDYWQALYDIDAADIDFNTHFPTDSSIFWRRIRVYEDYTPNKTFKAYVDKTRNEYVAFAPIDRDNSIPITSTGLTTIKSSLGSDINVTVINITSEISDFSSEEIDRIILYDNDGVRQLHKIQINLNDPLFGLAQADEFVLVSNVLDRNNIEYRIFTLSTQTNFLLSTNFDVDGRYGAQDIIYQLASRSQFYQAATAERESKSFHQELPSPTSNVWKLGDVCGKALSSCALRFQAKVVYETLQQKAIADQIDLGNIEVPFQASNFESDGEIVISQGYDFLESKGYVTPFIHNISQVEVQKIYKEYNAFPGTELINSDGTNPTSIDIATDISNFSFRVAGAGGSDVLSSSVIGKLHAEKVGQSNAVYPVSKDDGLYGSRTTMQSLTFVYEKTSPNKIRLYHLQEFLDDSEVLPSVDDAINFGSIVTFSGATFGTMQIKAERQIMLYYDTIFVSAGHTINYPVQSIFFNFLTNNTVSSEYNSYIATDRATSNSLPFGGFPGTKRFS